jgi:hypothetical protein
MADIQGLKENVQREIDAIAPLLIACSDWMADNTEIGLQGYQASTRFATMLEESGAAVERGIAELPTAFRAALAGSRSAEPTIALLAEYDALPEGGRGRYRHRGKARVARRRETVPELPAEHGARRGGTREHGGAWAHGRTSRRSVWLNRFWERQSGHPDGVRPIRHLWRRDGVAFERSRCGDEE